MEVIEDTYEEIKEELPSLKEEWDEIINSLKPLECYSTEYLKQVIPNLTTEEELEDLRKKFIADFKDIDDKDKLKIECLSLLGRIGIDIFYE